MMLPPRPDHIEDRALRSASTAIDHDEVVLYIGTVGLFVVGAIAFFLGLLVGASL